jgi:hypothetical protein
MTKPDFPLPRGLFRHFRKYRARRSHAHPWEYFGNDYVEALRQFAAWKVGAAASSDTVGGLLAYFVDVACPAKVRARQLAPRTARDRSRFAADQISPRMKRSVLVGLVGRAGVASSSHSR